MRTPAPGPDPHPDSAPGAGVPPPLAPPVPRPVMLHRWRRFTFLHWRYPAEAVQRLLPPGMTVETFNAEAWVGVLPFRMEAVRAPGLPPLPWLSQFPETNVRTYVRGPDGRTGIWFFSLDAARLPAVAGGRLGYGLPYCWSDMAVEGSGATRVYRSRRRWPGPPGARCHARVTMGAPLDASELGPLDYFLTARYRLYSRFGQRLITANAAHEPWPLHRAEVSYLDQDLTRAAGLPDPGHDPVVHASPGVTVRIGMWHPV
jgi:uncharacterized protein YqjF (DUF2071 family)